MQLRYIILFILFSLLLTACGVRKDGSVLDEDIFRPPTMAPTSLPEQGLGLPEESESAPEELQPSPTPICTKGLGFIADLTIPDGTLVEPRETLDKRWEVQNSGTCNWDNRYKISLIAGPGMGVPVQQALVPALAGTQTIIRMIFIAPEEPGNYRSAWQAYDPDGNAFGDPFFIDIVVMEEE